jgi:hypothetical protein
MPPTAQLPWASGPAEILRHGLGLLKSESDTNRRLAMISIDNAVELMIKTYLGLPNVRGGCSGANAHSCRQLSRCCDAQHG